jgi:hypothetical protein
MTLGKPKTMMCTAKAINRMLHGTVLGAAPTNRPIISILFVNLSVERCMSTFD